ncbi:MAG: class I SAM-dependent methyltransferase [Candidatus Heimdallarchaeota archaeon]
MSFNLSEKGPLVNLSKNLKKTIGSKFYTLLEERVGGAPFIEALGQNFVPVLTRWSLEAILNFCTDRGVFSTLEDGKTVIELLFDLEWKNEAMLEDILDSLVEQTIIQKHRREYRPLDTPKRISADKFSWSREWIGLRETDRKWIEHSFNYQIVFRFYNRLLLNFVMESMTKGIPTVKLGSEAPQLCAAFDSLLRSPAHTIPRMAAVAAGIVRRDPKTILNLNSKSGWGIIEVLLCKSDVDFILGVDSNNYQLEIAKKNIELSHDKLAFKEKAIDFRVIDDFCSLTDQLKEFRGSFDMVLVDQLPAWLPKETHTTLVNEIWCMLHPDGIIALYQPFRPSPASPWPDEWILRTIDGFYGYPTEFEFLKLLKRRPIGVTESISTKSQTIIPLLAYLIYI